MVDTVCYRIFNRLIHRAAILAIYFDAMHKLRIFIQPSAARSQAAVMAVIDIQHPDCQLQAGREFGSWCIHEGISQP